MSALQEFLELMPRVPEIDLVELDEKIRDAERSLHALRTLRTILTLPSGRLDAFAGRPAASAAPEKPPIAPQAEPKPLPSRQPRPEPQNGSKSGSPPRRLGEAPTAPPEAVPGSGQSVASPVKPRLMETYRKDAAQFLLKGPARASEIADECQIPNGSVSYALNYPWFEKTDRGYCLTPAGRQVVG